MRKYITATLATIILSSVALSACSETNLAEKEASTKISAAGTSMSQNNFDGLVKQGVPANALKMALKAHQWAVKEGKVKNERYLTVVEFDQPSTNKRLQVIDLTKNKVLFNQLVSQGAGSGRGKMATKFSDKEGSHASVLGAMVTEDVYVGKHGQSLRLNGLEARNKNVMQRSVVVHSANYATESFAKKHGYLGHSWGCFAVAPDVSPEIIKVIKGGTVLFAYSPQLNNDLNYS